VECAGGNRPADKYEKSVMIKNVVFDLGNVLLDFKPPVFLDKKNFPERIKTTILNDVFGSREWLMLDNGDITVEDAVEAIASRSSLKREEIARIFNLRTEIIFPLTPNIKLLPELKKHGFRLYFLSNFPIDIWEEVKSGNDFFNYFEGGLISAEAHASKPDKLIYEIFINKFAINPEECLYIDDLEPNVRGAVDAGMTGFVTHGSLEIAEDVRKLLGIDGTAVKH
jgi:putative hydrolase of the HAD superfamily